MRITALRLVGKKSTTTPIPVPFPLVPREQDDDNGHLGLTTAMKEPLLTLFFFPSPSLVVPRAATTIAPQPRSLAGARNNAVRPSEAIKRHPASLIRGQWDPGHERTATLGRGASTAATILIHASIPPLRCLSRPTPTAHASLRCTSARTQNAAIDASISLPNYLRGVHSAATILIRSGVRTRVVSTRLSLALPTDTPRAPHACRRKGLHH